MVNKRLIMGFSKFAIVSLIALSISGVAHASTGDIINTTNKKIYKITSSNDIKSLIADLKDGGGDVFLKESSDGKYYSPNDILTTQSAEIAKLLKAGNVDFKNPGVIKAYISTHATTVMDAIKAATDKIVTQTVDTTSYTTPVVNKLIVSSVSAINITKTVGDVYTLPTTVTAILSDGTTKNLEVTWDKVASSTVAGTYTFTGTLSMVDGVVNTNNINVSATLTIASNISDNTDITSKFTDKNFKHYVYSIIGKSSPEPILYSDVKNIKTLYATGNVVTDTDVSNLSGIEDFTSLTSLHCAGNNLTTLDLSKNTALTSLDCSDNKLTILDLSKNTALTSLDCSNNELITFDLSKNTALTDLDCRSNNLTTLDLSKNTALASLDCSNNELITLDLSENTALTSLDCSDNKLTILDLSKNTTLISLNCRSNELITLDLSKSIALTDLNAVDNKLTTLDLSKNTALTVLGCESNKLTTLDLSKNTALTELYCFGSNLTTLDLSKNTALTYLDCRDNELTTLDLSENTALTYLNCAYNKLTTLDLSKNTALTELDCVDNELTTLYSTKDTWDTSFYRLQHKDSSQTTTTKNLVITIKI
ncbi:MULTISPECIES: Ig-like domain-containing protein [Clostridium]|uniref:Ig-like domain-containing protein n=1 Tax=Clostridium frigoriphilum TaxID=443253 RepID=A0ABU7UTS5_9CLOT|nr:Ig-like domain-containing protein [Clostridium sp. DSM 17811]MBU3102448.1 Ig-like domain-containing protein [Clostridium sp. DSM 17811]